MPSRRRHAPGIGAGQRPRGPSSGGGPGAGGPRAGDGGPRAGDGGQPASGHRSASFGRGAQALEPARVLIDGRNVQRALERGAGIASLPTAALISRLRAAFSPPIQVELVLDGHRGGGPVGKIAPGFVVTFSRDATADQVIAERAADALRELGPAGAWSVLVVSDDREVQSQARRHGARAEGTAWLAGRFAGGGRGLGATVGSVSTGGRSGTGSAGGRTGPRPGSGIGHGRPPRMPRARPDD